MNFYPVFSERNEIWNMKYLTLSAAADLAHFRHFRHFSSLYTNDQRLLKIYSLKGVRKNSYEIFSFLCKTNPILSAVGGFQMNVNLFTTKDYEKNADFRHGKTKPKQTQSKPILGQYQGCQSQNKPNSKPIQSQTKPI